MCLAVRGKYRKTGKEHGKHCLIWGLGAGVKVSRSKRAYIGSV